MMPPRWKAGLLHAGTNYGKLLSSTQVLNELRLYPVDVPRPVRIDRIASIVSVAAASATLRWAIYADDGAGLPGRLLLDTGAVGDASATGLKPVDINLALGSRRYWVGLVNQGAACSMRSSSSITQHVGVLESDAASIYSNDNGPACVFQSGVTGACPATFTSGGPRNQAPVVLLRAA